MVELARQVARYLDSDVQVAGRFALVCSDARWVVARCVLPQRGVVLRPLESDEYYRAWLEYGAARKPFVLLARLRLYLPCPTGPRICGFAWCDIAVMCRDDVVTRQSGDTWILDRMLATDARLAAQPGAAIDWPPRLEDAWRRLGDSTELLRRGADVIGERGFADMRPHVLAWLELTKDARLWIRGTVAHTSIVVLAACTDDRASCFYDDVM